MFLLENDAKPLNSRLDTEINVVKRYKLTGTKVEDYIIYFLVGSVVGKIAELLVFKIFTYFPSLVYSNFPTWYITPIIGGFAGIAFLNRKRILRCLSKIW